MRIRYMFLCIALAFTIQARAQVGLYGTVTGNHLGSIRPPYPYTSSYGFWVAGGTFGLYDDFIHAGPVRLGVDLRGSILNSKGHTLNSGLAGLRVAFKLPVVPLKPYLQASAGAGSTNFGVNDVTTTGFIYQGLGGLDFTFFPRLDWRVVEVGGGAFRANGANYPMVAVSTGIVFRIPW